MSRGNKNLAAALKRIAAMGLLTVAMAAVSGSVAAQNTAAKPAQTETSIIRIAANPTGGPQRVSLSLNKALVVELDADARDVVIANPEIVDAVVRTPRRIFIMALKIGQTNAIFLDAEGRQIGTLDVFVGSDVADLNDQIARQLKGAKVKAEALNDNVVLNGTVTSAHQASQAQEMAARFAGEATRVVNALSIEQASQVLIKVRVAEMSRTIAKQLGVNVTAAVGSLNGTPIFASTDNQFSLLGRALSNLSGARIGSVGAQCLINALVLGCDPTPNNVQGVVQALEDIGLVRTLAEPNLTAVSGEAARFLAGGEFPVPISRDRDGNITVAFKQFGVGLAFTPVVLDKGHISLQVSTEVSELTNAGAFSLAGSGISDGLTIPALAVRRAETTVELPSGGSLVIGGLLQNQTKQNINGFPGLKDLPILGALFRSRDYQNSETELVVMVTAYLVDPVSEARLTRPDTGFVVPTDIDTILLGRLNSVYGRNVMPANAPRNTIGYIVE
jgi:pilus assembly protein CpaC